MHNYWPYIPQEAVAEVSKDKEPKGRKCGIELVRQSIDFRFNCFAFHLVWTQLLCQISFNFLLWIHLRFNCFETWKSMDLRCKWFATQLLWGSNDFVVNWFEIQAVWLSFVSRLRWFDCQSLIWDSNGLRFKYCKWLEIQVSDLRFK